MPLSLARTRRRAQATLAGVLAARGERAEAEALIEAVLDGSYRDHHVAYALGAAYAQLGMRKEALERLTEARSTGFECLHGSSAIHCSHGSRTPPTSHASWTNSRSRGPPC